MKIWQLYRFQIILFVTVFVVYGNTLGHDYAYDDAIAIIENQRVQEGWSGIPKLIFNVQSDGLGRYGYRPITLLTFTIEHALFGNNPFWGHLGNLIFYGLLCCLIFKLLKELFATHSEMVAFIATLLFLVHPLHVEVVANIKSRDEILALFFGVLALLQYWNFLNTKSYKFILGAALLFLCSFLSKENGIVLTTVCLLLPFLKEKTSLKQILHANTFGLTIIIVLLVTWVFSQSDFLIQSDALERAESGRYLEATNFGNPIKEVESIGIFIANVFYLLFIYLKQFLLPTDLLHDYSYNQINLANWGTKPIYFSFVIYFLMIVFGVRAFLKKRAWGFGILFFIFTLFIYLHIIKPAPDILANRFMFTPSLGLCVALVYGLHSLTKEYNRLSILRKPHIAIVPLLILCILTVNRNLAWADTRTLLETDLHDLENCARANYNYATVIHNDYYNLPEAQKLKEQQRIVHYYKKSQKISNNYVLPLLIDLGAAYMEFGYPDSAKQVFLQATELFGHTAVPHFELGRYYISQNNYQEAEKSFQKAIDRGSKNVYAHYYLGISYLKQKKNEKALSILEKGYTLTPISSEYHNLLSRMYVSFNRLDEAKAVLEDGIHQYPEDKALRKLILSLCGQIQDKSCLDTYKH